MSDRLSLLDDKITLPRLTDDRLLLLHHGALDELDALSLSLEEDDGVSTAGDVKCQKRNIIQDQLQKLGYQGL